MSTPDPTDTPRQDPPPFIGTATSASAFCHRCGQVVGTWHPQPQCDAYYAMAYQFATLERAGVTTVNSETQYGVRMCDGEVPSLFSNRQAAVAELYKIRERINSDDWEVSDYEPMTIVQRTHTVVISPWLEVSP